jgi:hypothetical protein
MKILFLALLTLISILSNLTVVVGQDDALTEVTSKDVEQVVYGLMQYTEKNDHKAALSLLSKEYLAFADTLKKMIGGNVDVEKRIIKDFNFYSVTLPVDFQIKNTFAIVSFVMTPNGNCNVEALRKRRTSQFLWTGSGGNIYGEKFLVDGSKNIVTYYMVSQNRSWKLHNSYFSDSPLTPEQKSSVFDLMEKHMYHDKQLTAN